LKIEDFIQANQKLSQLRDYSKRLVGHLCLYIQVTEANSRH